MFDYPQTIIIRHRKENLKKCSLRGLELRDDMYFTKYPSPILPELGNHILLGVDGIPLSEKDYNKGLVLLDGTWKYAEKMFSQTTPLHNLPIRSIPPKFITAYPRRQEDCSDPERGLASIEALFIAYHLMGRSIEGLLDYYHWKKDFLSINSHLL